MTDSLMSSAQPVTAAPQRPYTRPVVWLVLALAVLVMGLWLLGTPSGVAGKADAIGYAVCHRIPARSFHVHGRPLPLCARCTGIYLGVMTALALYAGGGRLRASRLPSIKLLAVLLLPGVAIAIDGVNSYLSLFEAYHPLYHPHNTLRLLTGMYAGLTLITVVLPIFNTTVWRAPDLSTPLRGWRDLALLYAVGGLVSVLVLLQLPVVLVVLGYVSALGVLLMFVLIGTVLFLTFTRRENTITRWRGLALPALAGLVFALLIIGGIDFARYTLTGTWEGFTLLG